LCPRKRGTDDRRQRTEDRMQMTEGRIESGCRISADQGIRMHETEDIRRRTEACPERSRRNRGQMTEVRGQSRERGRKMSG
jgi:hypothetical protein